MRKPPPPPRHGMTLVELLVVVAILGLLSAVVLPAIGTTTEARRYREAGRSLSTFIARAQSRAINSDDAKGLILQPLPANPAAAIDLYFANAPKAYAGQGQQSRAAVDPSGMALQLGVDFIAPDGAGGWARDDDTIARLSDPLFSSPGDLIQFAGSGPFYEFLPPAGGARARIRMRSDFNQTPRNTAWPRTTATGAPYRLLAQPRRASSGVLQLQRGAAIDVAWSCLGGRTLGRGGILATAALQAPLAIMFDAAGKPSDLVHSGGLRTRITEPLFLLVGALEAAGNDPSPDPGDGVDPDRRSGANWQYADSVWLCLDHNTGLVKSGPVDRGAANVFESQRFIRLTIGLGVAEQ